MIRRTSLLLVLLLAACSETPPTRFYTLAAVEPAPAATETAEGSVVLALAPIGLPAYLNRPQLVVQIDETRMELADLDNWIEPLDTLIQRTMAADLQREPHVQLVLRLPERRQSEFDYGIEVNFTRFDTDAGGVAHLDADWSIVDSRDREIARRHVSEQVEVANPEDKASHALALSRLLDELNASILAALPGTS